MGMESGYLIMDMAIDHISYKLSRILWSPEIQFFCFWLHFGKEGNHMAQIQKILCAVDFAENSPQVADYARTLAEAFQAELHVVYVAPTLAQYVGFQIAPSSIENFVGEIISGAEQTMDTFLSENFAPDQAQGHVLSGYAAEEILAFANEHNVDLIVMGTHGRKGIDRILFGSVAEKVVKSASMPVVTLRPRTADTAD